MRISDWSSDVCSSDLLMDDMAGDLGTRLDWVAVDHWNTDNPHIHVLVRGVDETGADLVIHRDYIRDGMRARAEECVTIELGPRTEQAIGAALEREVDADRWTSLHRRLQRMRSAVHTSELQSLMRISYAVSWLTKKR